VESHEAANSIGDPIWPIEVRAVLARSLTAEYASLTRSGVPVTVPTTPYVEDRRRTIDVSTGLTYPAKAERARRDPRVCLLFADPIGSGLPDAPVVLVQGLASVRDSDLQANTDRYVRLSSTKLPETTAGRPKFFLRRMAWYYARIWIEITPLHMRWWPSRSLEGPVSRWEAPEGTAAALSDPAPPGEQPHAWLPAPRSWHELAAQLMAKSALCDLTVVDANGFPLCIPVTRAELISEGFELDLGPCAPELREGPACITLHTHAEVFKGQENRTIIGSLRRSGTNLVLHAERALAHWSIAGGSTRVAIGFLGKGRRLAPRLSQEASRRSQPVPVVRFPGDA